MKRTMKLVAYAMMMMAPSICLTGCSDDNDDAVVSKQEPVELSADVPVPPEVQKQQLDQIIAELRGKTKEVDFSRVTDLLKYMHESMGPEKYDWKEAGERASAVFQKFAEFLKERERPANPELQKFAKAIKDAREKAVAIAKLHSPKGEFTAEGRKWVRTKSADEVDYTRFIFEDEEGTPCSLTFERSTITLVQGEETLLIVNVDVDLSGLKQVDPEDPERAYAFDASVELPYNGFEAIISNKHILGPETGVYLFSIKKDNELIYAAAFADTLEDLPGYQEPEGGEQGEEADEAKSRAVEINLLDKVQLRGTIKDYPAFLKSMHEAQRNDEDEDQFKYYVAQANECLDLNIYYEGGQEPQAKFEYAAFEDGDYWVVKPVIIFGDETSYALSENAMGWKIFRAIVAVVDNVQERFLSKFITETVEEEEID